MNSHLLHMHDTNISLNKKKKCHTLTEKILKNVLSMLFCSFFHKHTQKNNCIMCFILITLSQALYYMSQYYSHYTDAVFNIQVPLNDHIVQMESFQKVKKNLYCCPNNLPQAAFISRLCQISNLACTVSRWKSCTCVNS